MTRVLLLLAAIVYLVAAIAFGSVTHAHSFYSSACCSGRDCTMAAPGDVTWTPAGYVVKSTGETIPLTDPRIQHSPPGEPGYRLCVPPYDAKARCLYVPEVEG